MSGLQKIRISDFGRVVTGKTPSTKSPELFGDTYPFITPTDLEYDSPIPNAKRGLSKEGCASLKNIILPANSICFTCIASIGKMCITKQLSFTNQQINTIIVDHNKHNYWFVYYLLRTQIEIIKGMAGGVATPIVNKSIFANVEVTVPSLFIQQKIAGILSAYDDYIENNIRRIQILEEMAQRIYREWFVHFRFPGHENVKMVESELGMIPEGWQHGVLKDVCEIIPGYAFKSKDWSDEGVTVIKIKNIRPGNMVDISQVDHVPEEIILPKHDKYVLKNGDFLIAMTGATAGKVGKLRTRGMMLLNQRVARIDPDENFKEYVWCRIGNNDAEKEFFRLADGAAQPNMSGSQIESVNLLIPQSDVLKQFKGHVSPILKQIDTLIFINTNLRQTRDLLLPKLISGKIDVSDLDIDTGTTEE